MRTKLKVEGMTCLSCVQHVEDALTTVDGVERATADPTSNTATVDGTAKVDALIDAVDEAGYTASQ